MVDTEHVFFFSSFDLEPFLTSLDSFIDSTIFQLLFDVPMSNQKRKQNACVFAVKHETAECTVLRLDVFSCTI